MDKHAAEFMGSGYLNAAQYELLRKQIDELLGALRPQALSIVEGFACPE